VRGSSLDVDDSAAQRDWETMFNKLNVASGGMDGRLDALERQVSFEAPPQSPHPQPGTNPPTYLPTYLHHFHRRARWWTCSTPRQTRPL
jgi:hypothetical protein